VAVLQHCIKGFVQTENLHLCSAFAGFVCCFTCKEWINCSIFALSLRKFLVRIVGQDLVECNCSSADRDNTVESAKEFNCRPIVLLSIVASFGELSHRDSVMQIYAPLPFPFATVIPNDFGGFVKRFVKIVQLCNNESTGQRIVQEEHTFCLGNEGVLFGNAVVE